MYEICGQHRQRDKEQLKFVQDCLEQLDATSEAKPILKSKSSLPLVGGRRIASPSSAELLSVEGTLKFEFMDLTKLQKPWVSSFCRAAEEERCTVFRCVSMQEGMRVGKTESNDLCTDPM